MEIDPLDYECKSAITATPWPAQSEPFAEAAANPRRVLRDRPIGAVSRNSHIWERDANDFYVEPQWCSIRLYEEEEFQGEVWDPCCGWGRIVRSAIDAGYAVRASDIVIRPSGDAAVDKLKFRVDFRDCAGPAVNIVCNPPYRVLPTFTQLALKQARRKVAVIFPVARLNAAGWLANAPLRRIWLMSPRPPMPPGWYLEAGHKPVGGRVDFCWLIFEHGYCGEAEVRWLRRTR
jgi:hypothetical protein